MDLALVLEEIRPASRYRLNKAIPPDQKILEWRGPGTKPTQQELDVGWIVVSTRIAEDEAASTKRLENRNDAKARFLLSQLNDKTPQQISTQMQNKMDNWSSLADAKADLREWLPLFGALLASNLD